MKERGLDACSHLDGQKYKNNKKNSFSLLWYLGEQKRKINTYMLSTYERSSITITFIKILKKLELE